MQIKEQLTELLSFSWSCECIRIIFKKKVKKKMSYSIIDREIAVGLEENQALNDSEDKNRSLRVVF